MWSNICITQRWPTKWYILSANHNQFDQYHASMFVYILGRTWTTCRSPIHHVQFTRITTRVSILFTITIIIYCLYNEKMHGNCFPNSKVIKHSTLNENPIWSAQKKLLHVKCKCKQSKRWFYTSIDESTKFYIVTPTAIAIKTNGYQLLFVRFVCLFVYIHASFRISNHFGYHCICVIHICRYIQSNPSD